MTRALFPVPLPASAVVNRLTNTYTKPAADGFATTPAAPLALDGFQRPVTTPVALPSAGLMPGGSIIDLVQMIRIALQNMGIVAPGQPTPSPITTGPQVLSTLKQFEQDRTSTEEPASTSSAATAAHHKKKPRKPDADKGTPFFDQDDRRWGRRTLGRRYSIADAGCAMTATAMAISKISGKKIDPKQLDHYLDTHHGYTGDVLNWDRAANARGLNANRWGAWSLSKIDKNLRAGKPVCIGVSYKKGGFGGANGTDHWITVTARRKDKHGRTYYVAHDPGTGRRIKLYKHGSTLKSPPGTQGYTSTRQLVTFSRK